MTVENFKRAETIVKRMNELEEMKKWLENPKMLVKITPCDVFESKVVLDFEMSKTLSEICTKQLTSLKAEFESL